MRPCYEENVPILDQPDNNQRSKHQRDIDQRFYTSTISTVVEVQSTLAF